MDIGTFAVFNPKTQLWDIITNDQHGGSISLVSSLSSLESCIRWLGAKLHEPIRVRLAALR